MGTVSFEGMNRRTALKSLFALSVSRSAASVGRHPLKVAVLGHTGRGNFGHGLDTMWLDLPGVSWVAVSDADSGGLNQVKAERPELAAFSSYEDLLTEIRPDVVAVSPRHVDQHHAMCLAAIHAGAKGLYVEKPFCRTPKEADEIIAACQQKHVRLAVAHRNRYHPALPVLKQALENGLIGQWLEIRARGKEDHRGGAQDLWVLGSHVINVATYLGGHASSVQGQLYQDGRICDTDDLREGDEGLGLLAGNEIHARWTLDHGLPLFFDSTAGHAKKGGGFGLQCIGTEGVVDLQMDKEPMIHVRLSSPFNPTPGWSSP